jgi:hypothetical protein
VPAHAMIPMARISRMQYVIRRATVDMTVSPLEGIRRHGRFTLIFRTERLNVATLALREGFRMSGEFVHDGVTTLHHGRLKFFPVNLARLRLGQHLTFFFLDMVLHQFT